MDTHDYNRRHYGKESLDQARWVPAFVLIVVGAVFLLRNLGLFPVHELLRYWPVALIAIGLFRLVDSDRGNERVIGAILILAGAVLLAGTLGSFYLSWNTLWPLVLIGAGLLMLVQRFSLNVAWPSGGQASPEWLHEAAIFSGGKRRVKGNFKGGRLECIFGGFEIDMRQAAMLAEAAELEINAIFGGAEIKVPESWEVVMRGTGIFGGFSDETAHPDQRRILTPSG